MRSKSKLAVLAVVACAAAVVSTTTKSYSADHRDAPATKADPAADINDVFGFVDGNNVVMAMTVFPFAMSGASFSNATQYVFHASSGAAFGKTTSDVDVICTFASAQSASCWVGGDDYVTGDPSGAAGMTSTSGKVKVFAGLRADPFFFNLSGFMDTVTTVEGAASKLTFDPAGCPAVDDATSKALVGTLSEVASTANPSRANADDFVAANGLAIVVSVDKSLVTKGGSIVSLWASTNKAP
jgi:hypothetical protein